MDKGVIDFTKMQAYGNDFVCVDAVNQSLTNLSELARFVSDRHFGIGADGMILVCPSEIADFGMRIFNPDGTEAEMCGNALRNVGKFVYDHRMTSQTKLRIETMGGVKNLWLSACGGTVTNIRADIGVPLLDTDSVPVNTDLREYIEQPVEVFGNRLSVTAISWGNPHIVTFVEDVMNFDVPKYGRELEHRTDLFPNKTNVTFAQVIDKGHIKIREWERGTGETIGCGTGCCSAVTAGVLTGRCLRDVDVEQIGGVLTVEWEEPSGLMYMTGPSHTVFESEIDVSHIMKIA